MLKSLIKPIMHFDFSQILFLLRILNDKLWVCWAKMKPEEDLLIYSGKFRV